MTETKGTIDSAGTVGGRHETPLPPDPTRRLAGMLRRETRAQDKTTQAALRSTVHPQFSRRIIGFAVHRGIVDGVAVCRMFNRAIRGQSLPKYLSTDNDPLIHDDQHPVRPQGRGLAAEKVEAPETVLHIAN